MISRYLITFTSFIVCIQCENLSFDENGISVKSVDESWESQRVHHHRHRHGMSTLEQHLPFLSDEPNAVTQTTPLDVNNINQNSKYVDSNQQHARRTKFRQRKINGSGGSHRKTTFRRGQRHRNNKNGKTHISRQQIQFVLLNNNNKPLHCCSFSMRGNVRCSSCPSMYGNVCCPFSFHYTFIIITIIVYCDCFCAFLLIFPLTFMLARLIYGCRDDDDFKSTSCCAFSLVCLLLLLAPVLATSYLRNTQIAIGK